jgi:dolichyldiphosphatase
LASCLLVLLCGFAGLLRSAIDGLLGAYMQLVCRNLEQGALLAGFLLNEVINTCLKHSIKQARPEACIALGLGICDSYGFPSSHSQCIWYYITAGWLLQSRSMRSHGNSVASARSCSDATAVRAQAALSCLVSAAAGIVVPASRVVLGYHSVMQVVAGSLMGMLTGAAWYVLLSSDKMQAFLDWLEQAPFGCIFAPRHRQMAHMRRE